MTKQQLAQEIFNDGRIVNGDKPDTYIVNSESGSSYNVKLVTDPMYNYEYYCTCPAWKFDTSRECKHVLAIKLLLQASGNVKTKVSSSSSQRSKGWFVSKSNCPPDYNKQNKQNNSENPFTKEENK